MNDVINVYWYLSKIPVRLVKFWVLLGGKERPGRDADPSPPSSAFGHERVELYLYSPYGPYGLYRALVPVQGVHFTFTFLSDLTLKDRASYI